MTEQQNQTKTLAVSNYDRIKALARNQVTIQRFAEVLGSRREAQAYVTSAMLAVANSEDLMECTPSSIFNSAMRAAALRLYCDPALRQAHLVPFNTKVKGKNGQPDRWVKTATLIPGYIGINQLAHRTRQYRYLNTGQLYEGQRMEINQLTGAAAIQGERTGNNVIGYFHYFELLSGASHTFFMTVEELKAYGERYAPKNPMWKTQFPDMARKTVTKQNLLKYGILDPADRAILNEIDEDRQDGQLIGGDSIDGQFTEIDDQQATQDAQAAAEAAANAPKQSAADALNDLYPHEKAQPETSQEKPWNNTSISLNTAKTEKSSDGTLYWDMATDQLAIRANSLNKSLKENHLEPKDRDEKMLNRDVITAILAYRAQDTLI